MIFWPLSGSRANVMATLSYYLVKIPKLSNVYLDKSNRYRARSALIG